MTQPSINGSLNGSLASLNGGLLSLAMVLVLAGCGGGGGSGGILGGGGDSTDTSTSTTPTLEISLLDSEGNVITTLNGNTVGTVRAVLSADEPSGALVNFSTTKGTFTPSDGSALTDGSGVATISIRGGTVAGAGTIRASTTVDSILIASNSVNFETDGEGGAVAETVEYLIDLATIDGVVDGNEEVALNATVTDSEGDPVPNVSVIFTTNRGNFVDEDNSGVTDASGVATVMLRGDGVAGEGEVTARATIEGDTISDTENFQSSNTNPTITITGAYVEQGEVDPGELVTFTAQVLDFDGETPIAGVVVDFTLTVGELSRSSVVTDADGNASVVVTGSATAGASTISVLATVNGIAMEDSETYDNSGDGPSISLDLSETEIGVDETVSVTATLRDGNGSLITSTERITFVTDIGSLDQDEANTTNGVATVNLTGAAPAGFGTVTASLTINGITVTGEGEFVQVVPELTLSLSSSADADACPFAPDNTVCFLDNIYATATLVEGSDNVAQSNVDVTFSLTSGLGVLDDEVDRSNSSGVAQVLVRPGKTPGVGTVTASATVKGVSVSDTAPFTTLGDAPLEGEGTANLAIVLSIVRVAADGTETDITSDAVLDSRETGTVRLVAEVRNHDDSLAVGIPVVFETSVGTMAPSNGLARTDEDGIAFVTVSASSISSLGNAKASILIDETDKVNTVSTPVSDLGNGGTEDVVIDLSFIDNSPLVETNVITEAADGDGTLIITVTDSGGSPAGNRIVTVTNFSGAELSGAGFANGQADTGDSGVVTLNVAVGTMDPQDTGSIVVVVDTTTQIVQFEVGFDIVTIESVLFNPTDVSDGTATSTISSRGTAEVRATISSGADATPQEGVEVTFSSECVELGLARIGESDITDASGEATVTYQDDGCSTGNRDFVDTITVTESASGQTDNSAQITVLAPALGSIEFDQVKNGISVIRIRETGGTDTATVIFKVLDEFGEALSDVTVVFALTSTLGDMELVSSSGLSDEDGSVEATVRAGFMPGTVRVLATIERDDGDDLSTLSDSLTVNTGIPDQNSMSIAATVLNIEGNLIDGERSTIIVRMADALNNPVADGSAISFTTELGAIDAQCLTEGADGRCTVSLVSQEPRAPLDPDTRFKNVEDDGCPVAQVYQEAITPNGDSVIDTYYRIAGVNFVQSSATYAYLTEDTDWELDGTELRCLTVACSGAEVLVTYTRAWLDEDAPIDPDELAAAAAQEHVISEPGVATAPFSAITGVPCPAAEREATSEASAYNGGLGQPYGGRSTVLAWAQGEEGFIDGNGNGQYDVDVVVDVNGDGEYDPEDGDSLLLTDTNGDGLYDPTSDTVRNAELFIDLPEAFLDKNDDDVFGNAPDDGLDAASTSVREVGGVESCYGPVSPVTGSLEQNDLCLQVGGEEELFIDFGDENDPEDRNLFNLGNQIYNGTLCPPEYAEVGVCTRELINIRKEIPILFSGSFAAVGTRSSEGAFINQVDLRMTADPDCPAGDICYKHFTSADVRDNSNNPIGTDTVFTIGTGATEVMRGVTDRLGIALTSSSGFVVLHVADAHNGLMPSETSIQVVVEDGGCQLTNDPTGSVSSGSDNGFSRTFFSLGTPETLSDPDLPLAVTVSVTAPSGTAVAYLMNCIY